MNIEMYSLQVVAAVVEEKSFSLAANKLRVTQSAISQQISKLETTLEGRLFERVGKTVVETDLCKQIYQYALEVFERHEKFVENLNVSRTEPEGMVRYAMPESCQWTPHFRKIMSQIREFNKIRFDIEIASSAVITEKLLRAEIDFGFIVGPHTHSELRFTKFSDEAYSLVGVDQSFFSQKGMRLVSYPGSGLYEEVFFGKSRVVPTAKIGTLAGAIHAVQEGAGVAVIPTHCVIEELKEKKLFELKSEKGAKRVSLPVYIAKRRGEKLPKRVEVVLDLLMQAKASVG